VKIRLEGLALLAVCALALHRFYMLRHGIPFHQFSPNELVLSMVVVLTAFAGAAMTVVGPPLFRPYEWPPRNRG
jgi:hypothetical protein